VQLFEFHRVGDLLATDLDGIADARKQAILFERLLNEVERAELDTRPAETARILLFPLGSSSEFRS
jgi:hypothetical protein